MPIRLSGINSGLDTDALVKELVSAYSLKKEKYQKEQTKIEWKQESWKSLNTKIYGLYTSVSNLQYDSAYNLKKSTVSDTTKAKVSAASGAVTGTQTLNVHQMAQAAYVTGAKIEVTDSEGKALEIKGTTKLSELGFTGDATQLKLTSGGKDTMIDINKDTTISDFVKKLNEAGVSANFDERNGRIFVSAKESGADGEFSITAESATGTLALASLGLYVPKATPADGATTPVNSYAVEEEIYNAAVVAGKDATTYIGDLLKEYKTSLDNVEKLQKEIAELKAQQGSDSDAIANKEQELVDAKSLVETKLSAIASSDTIPDAIKNLVNENQTVADLDAKITALANEVTAAGALGNAIGEGTATKIEAQNAVIRLNGVEYESSSNSFTINGLTVEVTGVTDVIGTREKEDGTIEEYIQVENPITISTTTDTQGIYDKVKDFLTEYNNVINEIAKLYNAESAKDYEPLTDEEKDAMSEEQIEKWENKIKDALLRRDSSLGSIMNTMVNTMAQGVELKTEVDGKVVSSKTMNLSDFGIHTLGFLNAAKNEHYAYHIDGDEDDENTSGKTDKLMTAIQDDPDTVCAFMKQLATNLYKAVDQKMKSTELSSAYKVYNDKELDSQLTKYKKLISDWEKKVSKEEEYYYDKFSQMEVALSKLQNQSNSLAGLLGQ